MISRSLIWLGSVAVLTFVLTATALAAPRATDSQLGPTLQQCARAWNRAANSANQVRLVNEKWRRAVLLPGVTGIDARGVPSTPTGPACNLIFLRPGFVANLFAPWKARRVSTWRWLGVTRVSAQANKLDPNYRVAADGTLRPN